MDRTLTLINLGRTDYNQCLTLQRDIQKQRAKGSIENTLLITEHNPVFTLGRNHPIPNLKVSTRQIEAEGIPIVQTERGGDITYHGPGQLVAYGIIALREWDLSAYAYIDALEEIMIRSLKTWGLTGERKQKITRGVWVDKKKIGSVGISIKRGVTMHGASLNVAPEMIHFSLMNPCGFENIEITSVQKECAASYDFGESAKIFAKEFKEFFDAKITN